MAEPHLSIRQLHKRFGRFAALHDVSLDVAHGEFICVLGPSGCGKTTLLRVVAGLETQDAGQVLRDGQDISFLPPQRRNFGIVFQSYALFPNLTAAQNIAYGLENLRRPRHEIKARVRELLALVGLPEHGSKYPAQLSGGEQQRVALARALATSPGLLLLDEPLSALDAQVRASLREEITRLQRHLGVTTVMVTHDQVEALSMADRIVVMDKGAVVQIGSPADIYHRPANPFVARFVGLMNFVPGQVGLLHDNVRAGNLTLNVAVDGHRSGDSVKLGIRPEDVRVANVALNMPNAALATLNAVEFLGSFQRLWLRLDSAAVELLADLSAEDARRLDAELHTGAHLPIQLPTDRILVFSAI